MSSSESGADSAFESEMSGLVKLRKAREFADLSRECPKRAKSDPKNPKQDPNQESDPNSNECSEDEIKLGKFSTRSRDTPKIRPVYKLFFRE